MSPAALPRGEGFLVRPRLRPALLGVAIGGAAVAILAFFEGHFNGNQYAVAIVATLAAILVGGWETALIVEIAATIASIWFNLEPHHTMIVGPQDRAGLLVYLAALLLGNILYLRLEWARRSATAREETAIAERRLLDQVLATSPSTIIAVAVDGTIVYANEPAFRFAGVRTGDRRGPDYDPTSWERRTLDGVLIPRDETPGSRVLREGRGYKDWRYQMRRTPADPWRILVTSAEPVFDDEGAVAFVVINTQDVTEEHRLSHELLQAQKLESIGRLAGGIAHDFNNILTVIIGYSEVVEDALRGGHPDASDVEQIRLAAERAASLTGQLLAFSRRQVIQPRPVDLVQVIDEFEPFLRRLAGPGVSLVIERGPPGIVRADPGQLQQVLLNLVVNARDAMPDGGAILLATAPGAANQICLTVTDQGVGIAPDLLDRIFDPFFTTKELGKGTGLGLATVHGIVTQAGGTIAVESEPSRGTTFRVCLPLHAVAPKGAHDARRAGPVRASAGATLLLVEDDDASRHLAHRALAAEGYVVVAAKHPAEALALASTGRAFDCVVTDLVMPGMSGVAMMERLRESHPGLPVVLMSGFAGSAGDAVERLREDAGFRFLAKPFHLHDLLDAVAAAREGVAAV